jgi:guanine deaminase
MDDTIGTLDVAKDADLIVINPSACLPTASNSRNRLADFSAQDLLSLLVYRGGAHAVVETFVRGRTVYCAPDPQLL